MLVPLLMLIAMTANTREAVAQQAEPLLVNSPDLAPDSNAAGDAPAALPGMAEELVVTDRGRVNMHVADLPLSTVLQMLAVQSQRNIVASPNVSGAVTANLFDVTFEEALSAVLASNGAGFETVGSFIYVRTQEEMDEIARRSTGRLTTRVFRLSYISSTDAVAYITPLVSEDDSVTPSPASSTDIASGSSSAGGQSHSSYDFIIVTAPDETLAAVGRLLTELDVRPRQVLIEATILRAELKDDNALGIDFTLVGGVDLELLNSVSSGITDVSVGLLPQDRFERFNATATTDFVGDVPNGGLTLGIIKDQVGVFLRALEQETNTVVLANPKILVLDKQKGQIIVGRRDGFLTTTVTQTQAIQTVEYLETGTQLIFRPYIAEDGYIRIDLHPEDSVGFVNAQGLPSEQTTEVTTSVIIRDGETILIGGLFREVTIASRNQVPGLGNLPLLGPLFRSRSDSTAREEVIILMTVTIIDDQAEFARESVEVLQDIERMRVGLRQGLMWHGRDRLAERHYQKAIEAMTEDDTPKALWHARMSVHNSSRFLPALRLRDGLLKRLAWDDEGTAARMFLHQLIARERGYDKNLFGRPPRAKAVEPRVENDVESQPAEEAPPGNGDRAEADHG